MFRFAIIHIKAPAGAETRIARPRIFKVRSKREMTMVFITCGLRKGGSSKEKEDSSSGKKHEVIILVIPRVPKTPIKIKTRINSAAMGACQPWQKVLPIKREDRVINIENRPLQGIKQLVIIAANRSRREL